MANSSFFSFRRRNFQSQVGPCQSPAASRWPWIEKIAGPQGRAGSACAKWVVRELSLLIHVSEAGRWRSYGVKPTSSTNFATRKLNLPRFGAHLDLWDPSSRKWVCSLERKIAAFLLISSSIGGLISSSIAGSIAGSSAGPLRAASAALAVIFPQELRSWV